MRIVIGGVLAAALLGSPAFAQSAPGTWNDLPALESWQSIIEVVPEPSTAAVGLLGCACWIAARRRRPHSHRS